MVVCVAVLLGRPNNAVTQTVVVGSVVVCVAVFLGRPNISVTQTNKVGLGELGRAGAWEDEGVRLPRTIALEPEARMALGQILGIMSDQAMSGEPARWDVERLMEVEVRLGVLPGGDDITHLAVASAGGTEHVTLGTDDAAMLLDGMAYTEIASADFPWIEMVRWTSDFVSTELRRHWTDDEWLTVAGGHP